MRRIFWAGDSTVQYNDISTYPQTGMGQVMNLFLKPEVELFNYAKNGRSTKSFMEDGRLDLIRQQIEKGDIFLIQFGHNDEKKSDATRYTTPFGTYMENLKIYVDTARQKEAYPVLITPVERRCFQEDGTLGPGEHGEYVEAMKRVAFEMNVPCIDLYTKSREFMNSIGPDEARKLHVVVEAGIYPGFPEGKNDHTHLNYRGAVRYASFIAEGLYNLGGIYREVLLDVF
ncbi:MAG: rhamnogalacturonan acetylesterase [Lachnospiraceae bacterium]